MLSYIKSKRDWAILCLFFQFVTAIALVSITVTQLDYSYYGVASEFYEDVDTAWAQNTCTLSIPTASQADWLCGYLYATAFIGFVLSVIIAAPVIAICCGKESRVWYRGGFYKAAQTCLLLTGFVFWLVLAIYVTQYGIEANTYSYMEQDAWRVAAIVLSWIATILLFSALALRVFDEGGSITRAEMDYIVSNERVIEIKNRGYFVDDAGDIRGWGSAKIPHNILQKRVLLEEQQKYNDGYTPDTKDPKDRIFIPWHPSWYGSWLTLPKLVDLTQSRYMPPVLDQGPYGTCVLNAAALAYGFTVCKEHRGTLVFFPSRLFLYFNTKYHIMGEYPDRKSGSYIRACCQALRKFGCCSEQSYPYKSSLVSCEPPGYVYNEAKKHRVSYYVVPQTRYDIYSALSQGHPIMVSLTYILSEMPDGKKCLYLNYPDAADMDTIKNSRSSKRVGHHAVCLVGYDRKTEVVKFRNSWGENWGDQGCFYAPLEYVLNPDLAHDLWIFRKAK